MTTSDAFRDAEYVANVSNVRYDDDDDGGGGGSLGVPTGTSASSRAREMQARVKTVYLNRLLRDFDVLIYCQLSLLYYMDCSIFHFAIRAIVQLHFFTPKTGSFPEAPHEQPYLAAVLISNASCILLHLVSANPVAGEALRGYLHGGLFIDFVGQKGPISKLQLFVVDLLVAIFQIVMLGAVVEKEKTKRAFPSENADDSSTTDPVPMQDQDAEERGVLRSGTSPLPAQDDIEMQELREPDTGDAVDESANTPNGLLSVSSHETKGYKHARDVFTSGEAIIMEMSVFHILRDQWRYTPIPNFHFPPASAPSGGFASMISRRRFGSNTGSNA